MDERAVGVVVNDVVESLDLDIVNLVNAFCSLVLKRYIQ